MVIIFIILSENPLSLLSPSVVTFLLFNIISSSLFSVSSLGNIDAVMAPPTTVWVETLIEMLPAERLA